MTIDEFAHALNDFCLERSYQDVPHPPSGFWNEMADYRKEVWRETAMNFLVYAAKLEAGA